MHAHPMIAAAAAAMTAMPAAAQAQAAHSRGTISVEPGDEGGWKQADLPFANAVRKALGKADFLALPGTGHGRYVARITVMREAHGLVAFDPREAPSQASAGDWAVRFRVTLPSRKTDLDALVVTRLTVDILERADMKPVWSGSALTAAADGASAAVADKLAEALIRRYPTPLRGPLPVP